MATGGEPIAGIVLFITQPPANPTAMPPRAIRKKPPAADHKEKPPLTAAAIAKRYATRVLASLTRLSPSSMVTRRRGTPRRWKTVVAAAASGGATIAPRIKAAGH